MGADLGWYGWWMSLGTLLLWLMTRMAIIMQSSVLSTAPAMGLLALVFLIRCLKIRPMLRFKQAMTQIRRGQPSLSMSSRTLVGQPADAQDGVVHVEMFYVFLVHGCGPHPLHCVSNTRCAPIWHIP